MLPSPRFLSGRQRGKHSLRVLKALANENRKGRRSLLRFQAIQHLRIPVPALLEKSLRALPKLDFVTLPLLSLQPSRTLRFEYGFPEIEKKISRQLGRPQGLFDGGFAPRLFEGSERAASYNFV